MFSHTVTRLLLFLVLLGPLALCAEEQAQKQEEKHWYNYDHLYLQGGTYMHYRSGGDKTGTRIFAALEAVKSNNYLYGLALFNNSFNQFSQYLYAGKSFFPPGSQDGFHAKITAGLIHGYRGEFKERIPFNDLGIGPAIIPGIGYKKGNFSGHVIVLGDSALLFTVGVSF